MWSKPAKNAPLRRAQQLHDAFQTAFEVLAEIYRDEDWRYINDGAGRPYAGFTAFVQDQLGCAASMPAATNKASSA